MGRNERTGVVDETRHSAATSGWPAALTPARQRKATFKNVAASFTFFFEGEIMRARAI